MEDRTLKQLQIKMTHPSQHSITRPITSFKEFIQLTNYSLIDNLNADPESTKMGKIIALGRSALAILFLSLQSPLDSPSM